jgi:hypothetical protein
MFSAGLLINPNMPSLSFVCHRPLCPCCLTTLKKKYVLKKSAIGKTLKHTHEGSTHKAWKGLPVHFPRSASSFCH